MCIDGACSMLAFASPIDDLSAGRAQPGESQLSATALSGNF